MSNIKIMKTVTPTEVLSQEEWLKWVRAGIAAKYNDSIDKARDMNNQYRENGSISSLYIDVIDRFASKIGIK